MGRSVHRRSLNHILGQVQVLETRRPAVENGIGTPQELDWRLSKGYIRNEFALQNFLTLGPPRERDCHFE